MILPGAPPIRKTACNAAAFSAASSPYVRCVLGSFFHVVQITWRACVPGARERPHPLLAAASPRSSTSHAGTPTARDRNHDRAAREQPSNSRVPLNGSVGRRLRESAYKVQLLEERLKHEAAQRKRLFSMLQV